MEQDIVNSVGCYWSKASFYDKSLELGFLGVFYWKERYYGTIDFLVKVNFKKLTF